MKMRFFIVAFLLVLVPRTVLSQQGRTLSVEECVAFGLENNHQLGAIRAGAREASAVAREARGALFPVVRGEGAYTRLSSNIPDFELTLPDDFVIPGVESAFSVPAILDRYDLTVRVEQPLFSGFRLVNQRRAAQRNARARLADAEAAATDVAYAIRVAYWVLFEALEAEAVAAIAERQMEAQLAAVVQRSEQGAALNSDVLAVQTRVGEVRLQALDARNAVSVARLNLNNVAGFPLDEVIEPVPPPPIAWNTQETTVLDSLALVTRPSLRARRNDVAAAEAGIRIAESGWLPSIFAVGLYQYARPNPYIFPQADEFKGTWQVGVSARWDLWDWGQTYARRQQARARSQQHRELLADERRAVRFAVREQLLAVEHRRLAASVAEQGVAEAGAAYSAMQQRYDLGAALTTELLAAELAERTARLRHARALAAYGMAQAALWREVGYVLPQAEGTP